MTTPASNGQVDTTGCNLRVDNERNVTVRLCREIVAIVLCECDTRVARPSAFPRCPPLLGLRPNMGGYSAWRIGKNGLIKFFSKLLLVYRDYRSFDSGFKLGLINTSNALTADQCAIYMAYWRSFLK
ncbi:hypothetical protein PUN4_350063 [Paraburkholderia unamae]|uniref:hypothetical protein n=1 Tax=Paraburkholderia unamae TaxID=219649 RepID=UPI001CB1A080|nr:hypothetical protein [Paraburkholderia unamae]CAG9260854.1 hypothetical protein PUN4_350063 [Paraburkholderia unamae]